MHRNSVRILRIAMVVGAVLLSALTLSAQPSFQGFETGIGDWQPPASVIRTASGGGTLNLPAFAGNYYAEVHNTPDGYLPGFGDCCYSYFDLGGSTPYQGAFSQSISMYVNANWPTAIYNGPGVWIDMSPSHPAGNYGGEHSFRITPTGSSVQVFVDGQATPIATITASGWYTFQMVVRKGAAPTDLAIADMLVLGPTGQQVGATTVLANSPGGPLLSQDLGGPGYVWLTVWPNGWANNVLAIDNVRTDFLPQASEQSATYQVRYLSNLNVGDSYVNISNNGAVSGNDPAGRLCANIYVFDPNEEPVSCCACPVTPNGTVSLSARNSLISNPLTPGVPTSVVVKVVFTENSNAAGCDAGRIPTSGNTLARGGLAWATTLHANTATSPASYQTTETSFSRSELSRSEYLKLINICNFIETYASKFGLCKGCQAGAMGAAAN